MNQRPRILAAWSGGGSLTGLFAFRALVNASLTARIYVGTGASMLGGVAFGLALVSLGVFLSVIADRVDPRLSLADVLSQLGLLVLAGWSVLQQPTTAQFGVVVAATLAAVCGMWASIPMYGEVARAP